jgi:hypothetical protein
MGQRLHLIRKDKYRLDLSILDSGIANDEWEAIKQGSSKNSYRFLIKERFKDPPIASFNASVVEDKIGFNLYTEIQFGSYIYVLEHVDYAGKIISEIAYGYIDIIPDV